MGCTSIRRRDGIQKLLVHQAFRRVQHLRRARLSSVVGHAQDEDTIQPGGSAICAETAPLLSWSVWTWRTALGIDKIKGSAPVRYSDPHGTIARLFSGAPVLVNGI